MQSQRGRGGGGLSMCFFGSVHTFQILSVMLAGQSSRCITEIGNIVKHTGPDTIDSKFQLGDLQRSFKRRDRAKKIHHGMRIFSAHSVK